MDINGERIDHKYGWPIVAIRLEGVTGTFALQVFNQEQV
jgi:hypothetical protein